MRRTALLIAASVAALLCFSCASASAADDGSGQVLSLLQQARSANGLAPLAPAEDLTAIAQRHAQEMAAAGSIWHQPLSPIDGLRVGENVGVGSSPDELHAAFMASPQHRDNILGDYGEVGIAVAWGADGKIYVDQVFRLPWPAGTGVDAPAAAAEPVAVAPAPQPAAATPAVPGPAAVAEPAPVPETAPQPTAAPTSLPLLATSLAEALGAAPQDVALAPVPIADVRSHTDGRRGAAMVAAALLTLVVGGQGLLVRRTLGC